MEVWLGLSLFFEGPETPSCLCHLVTEATSHQLKRSGSRTSILVVNLQWEPESHQEGARPACRLPRECRMAGASRDGWPHPSSRGGLLPRLLLPRGVLRCDRLGQKGFPVVPYLPTSSPRSPFIHWAARALCLCCLGMKSLSAPHFLSFCLTPVFCPLLFNSD